MTKKSDEPGPGHNGGDIDRDVLLYHDGRMEKVDKQRKKLSQEAAKIRKQAAADGIVLQTYKQAKKISELAPETNTEEFMRLKRYLEFMNQPLGYQMSILAAVKDKETATGTAFIEGRTAGIKGYLAKENPYDDPASNEAQSWLKGLHDGEKRRKEIEKGYNEPKKEAA